MKSVALVGILIATLLSVALSQPAFFGSCSFDKVRQFLETLPNGDACSAAEEIFVPSASTDLTVNQLESAARTFCTPDCGSAQAEYLARTCNDFSFALGIVTFCLPTGAPDGLNRCRFALPDLLDDALIEDLAACENATSSTCSPQCSDALQNFVDAVGCCFLSLYSSAELITAFAVAGYISPSNAVLLSSLAYIPTCGVTVPVSICLGNPFPGTRTLTVGTCTSMQIGEFIVNQLSETCVAANAVLFDRETVPSPTQDQIENAYDDLCTEDCQGAIEKYERDSCGDDYVPDLFTNYCYRTTGSIGSRCFSAVGENTRNAAFFTNVGATCFNNGLQPTTCPAGCQAALMVMSSTLGCCYQSFHNDTDFQNYILLSGNADPAEVIFLQLIGQNTRIWDVCGVPLVPKCTGEVLGGADRFIPSSIVTILAILIFVLFN